MGATFGEFVRARRKMLELTLEQVARKAGSHKGYISGIESGKVRPPSARMVKRMAKALRLKVIPLLLMAYAEKAPKEIRRLVELKLT